LIVQNDVGNRYASTTIVAAITATIKLYPVTVFLEKGRAGMTRDSMVNLAQMLTIDKQRLTRRLGRVDPVKMAVVDEAMRVSLGLPEA